jgi:hypothetical protein
VALAPPLPAQNTPANDALVVRALPEIAKLASNFWHSAPDYTALETLRQNALIMPKRRLRVGGKAVQAPKPEIKNREIVSYYAISFFTSRPEALHEFRQIVSVDGKTIADGNIARGKLRSTIDGKNDHAKKALLDDFDKANLTVSATDFGQLVLLFTRANLQKYKFESKTKEMVGADRTMVIAFHQSAGGEALRITEAGKRVNEPLSGQMWIRESDYQPLRITLNATRRDESEEIRDEARVDYASVSAGTFLPASVVYRRHLNGKLVAESTSEYSDWQPLKTK